MSLLSLTWIPFQYSLSYTITWFKLFIRCPSPKWSTDSEFLDQTAKQCCGGLVAWNWEAKHTKWPGFAKRLSHGVISSMSLREPGQEVTVPKPTGTVNLLSSREFKPFPVSKRWLEPLYILSRFSVMPGPPYQFCSVDNSPYTLDYFWEYKRNV